VLGLGEIETVPGVGDVLRIAPERALAEPVLSTMKSLYRRAWGSWPTHVKHICLGLAAEPISFGDLSSAMTASGLSVHAIAALIRDGALTVDWSAPLSTQSEVRPGSQFPARSNVGYATRGDLL
jgi:hypothetical protein